MAELPPYSTPRWVKIAGITVLVLVLLLGIMFLTGLGGEHGPGRHMPSGRATDYTRPASFSKVYPSSASGRSGHTLLIEHSVNQL